ncbi:hypothetical protein [Pendulispora albinea]|uniref:Uncharacterized protein n=1 Tax=Pendulispora albinea TaxID=2741071 RepID=A0ABZ2M9Q5_9BACT
MIPRASFSAFAVPVALALGAVAACSSKEEVTLALSTGGESEVFSREPAPAKLVVDAIDVSTGAVTNLTTVALPASNVDLGDQNTTPLIRVRANAVDAAGRVLVTGTSVAVQLGALEGRTLPIFVQRTSELARMPAPLDDTREAPLLASVSDRYLIVAGGANPANATKTQIYDFASLAPLEKPPTLPRAPKSLAARGASLLLVDDAGATEFSLADSASRDLTAPEGGTFAEVSGGATVRAPDGSLYIVGGTRTGAPTARVLKIGADGSMAFASLITARAGAAAVWAPGRGLVVAGGSEAGAGIELLAAGATATTALPYPADAVRGAAAAALDGARIVLGGGLAPADASTPAAANGAPTRLIDLGCTANCKAVVWDAAKLPTALTFAQAFELGTDAALVVGDDATGLSHAFRIAQQGATEIPFKVAHRGVRGVRVNPPAITFAGGHGTLESFAP